MLRRIAPLSALVVALPLLWSWPAAAVDFRPSCPADGQLGCQIEGTPPSLEVQPGEGRDTVTFENEHDARLRDGIVSSEKPGGSDLELPTEPPRGDAGSGDDHFGTMEPGDHHVFEGDSDALGGERDGDVPAVVPEPAELLLLAFAAGGLLLRRRRA